jgi:hypothetical protein
MNIFALSSCPTQCAMQMCDKHVVKMVVETAQLLSTAHRILDGHEYTAQRETRTYYKESSDDKYTEVIETPEKYEEQERSQRVLIDGDWYQLSISYRYVKRWALSDYDMDNSLYLASHVNHPCAIWARQSNNNYTWLYCHFMSLCDEYTYRYGKTHKTDTLLNKLLVSSPLNIEIDYLYDRPQCMPEIYKRKRTDDAYRAYYLGEKNGFAKWTRRSVPFWWTNATKELEGVS